jgi:micrococcal nuclease
MKRWAPIAVGVVAAAAFAAAVLYSSSLSSIPAPQELFPSSQEASGESEPVRPTGPFYEVIEVIDGDTIKVSIGGTVESVRLIGINSPETVDPRNIVECFGREASAFAKQLMSDRRVALEKDPAAGERDKYKRLLAYVFLEDGTHVNLLMVQGGYAYEYTYGAPYKYQGEFKRAEDEARAEGRGLWAESACGPDSQNPRSGPRFAPVGPDDKDCADFTTHAEAQMYFESKGGSAEYNVDNLDGDHDGRACETLP